MAIAGGTAAPAVAFSGGALCLLLPKLTTVLTVFAPSRGSFVHPSSIVPFFTKNERKINEG